MIVVLMLEIDNHIVQDAVEKEKGPGEVGDALVASVASGEIPISLWGFFNTDPQEIKEAVTKVYSDKESDTFVENAELQKAFNGALKGE